MTEEFVEYVILLVLTVILPINPAVILYKWLRPGTIEVFGPFKGLNIKLAGAFAGYFLVLLILVCLFHFRPQPEQYQVWRVFGKVSLENHASPQGIVK